MEYYFDEVDPAKFQRLINTILVARFAEDIRLTPLRGKDGGRDGETAPGNPYFEFQIAERGQPLQVSARPPNPGRYLFQVKHHRTSEGATEARRAVVSEFAKELENNVLTRKDEERVNYFFLVTNVPASGDSLEKVDQVRSALLNNVKTLHADVWWKERVTAHLDSMPAVWGSFPEIFAGGIPPLLSKVVGRQPEGLPRAIRIAIGRQYSQDKMVKFRQIELEKTLAKLFVDLDIDARDLSGQNQQVLFGRRFIRPEEYVNEEPEEAALWAERDFLFRRRRFSVSAIAMLLHDDELPTFRKMILQGGPGQGKSTITQMAAQIYRQQILAEDQIDAEGRWSPPEKSRLPFRVELRKLAEWLNGNPGGSIESYLSMIIGEDSGGNTISVNDVQTAVERSPVLLIFDGLDEIGSDKLRDEVLKAIMECVNRFENDLKTDLRVIITTRPPALSGRTEILSGFARVSLAPMEEPRIKEYIGRWLSVQIQESEEKSRIRTAYERRQNEPHVQALARNPMQLSVLLQFIRLKGEAFPDRRAELYREYFQIVIDRDVEKSAQLRDNRPVIQALHEFIGYRIHALTEINQADRTLDRARLIEMVREWLESRGDKPEMALDFFKLGEERFGLVVASKGEGEEARYGYEVQPIQEYFAAAYISNQMIPSGAHDTFENMLRRPYWREVALFLAGLRRPNEKADLILRATNVDRDKEIGWRQDGRAVIFQLLQEGVFSEPPYVYFQALEFVLELLDVRRLKVQREPSGLLDGLEMLMNRHSAEQHKEIVLGLLRDYENCTDEYALMRLYRIAGQVLTSSEYLKAALSYRADRPYLAAQIRLAWPYNRDIDFQAISRDHSFWEGVPSDIWAQVWWREATRSGMALDLAVPPGVHQHLFEEFATGAISPAYRSRRRLLFGGSSKLAVWKMYKNQQILQVIGVLGETDEQIGRTLREEFLSSCESNDTVDYTGIEEPIRVISEDLVKLSNELIAVSCTESVAKLGQASERYVDSLRGCLQAPGLTGWVACQCAVNFITSWSENRRRRISPRIVGDKSFRALVEEVRPFYVERPKDSDSRSRRVNSLDFLNTGGPRFRPYRIPPVLRCIRLKESDMPVPLVDIVMNSVSREKDVPFGWMTVLPLSSEILRSLIEKCQTQLEELLRMVGRYRVAGVRGRPLRVQDTQRVLRVARHTDNPITLAGSAAVLSNATVLRVAETELILKILQADSGASLAASLFRSPRLDGPDTGTVAKEIALTDKIARSIINAPDEYPFWTVCAAAGFIAQYFPLQLPPLMQPSS